MKKTVLTLALSLFAAVPAFANIEGDVAQTLFNQIKDEPGAKRQNTDTRQADLRFTTDTASVNGVYCVVVRSAQGEQANCAFNGQNVKGDAVSIIKALNGAGIFLGKPVPTSEGSLREISLQTLSCEQSMTTYSDYNHRIRPTISYTCTAGN